MCSPPPTRWQRPTHECYPPDSAPWCRSRTPRGPSSGSPTCSPPSSAGCSRSRWSRTCCRHWRRSASLPSCVVVTVDPAAAAIAGRYGARITSDGAHDGQTGAVMAAARSLAASGLDLLTVPGDIPLVEPDDIRHLLAAAWCRARLHDRAGARPERIERGALLAGRRGAAALRRQQLLSASRGRAGAGHRAARRAAPAHRARHRYARRPGTVPGNAVAHPCARAARSMDRAP